MGRRDLLAFGVAVRKHRARLSLSQEALAERSELHRRTVAVAVLALPVVVGLVLNVRELAEIFTAAR